jgi:dihydrofolate reductase
MVDLSFTFSGECWLWQTTASAWHFITLPEDKSEEIKFFNENLHGKTRGWGAVRVQVIVGKSTWETSIFPYAKSKAYILPIKAEVRKKEKILAGDVVEVTLKINV